VICRETKLITCKFNPLNGGVRLSYRHVMGHTCTVAFLRCRAIKVPKLNARPRWASLHFRSSGFILIYIQSRWPTILRLRIQRSYHLAKQTCVSLLSLAFIYCLIIQIAAFCLYCVLSSDIQTLESWFQYSLN